jgi:uncharacterized protein YneF (UPF0154 family)
MKNKKIKNFCSFNFNKIESKKAAMEMSVGTIVTIVLLMAVLILGIFLVQRIFKSSVNAIDEVDNEVQSQIRQLFAKEGNKIAIYPTSREITLEKGDTPKGFAFSVKNIDVEEAEFSYLIVADDVSKCGSTFSKEKADNMLIGSSGVFTLGPGNSLDLPRLVKFQVSETTPPCTMTFNLEIEKDSVPYTGAQIFVTIK